MSNINYKKICEELYFDEKDIYVLVECMQSLYPNLDTTDKIIDQWEKSCFRADDFEEILEQLKDLKRDYGDEIKELQDLDLSNL